MWLINTTTLELEVHQDHPTGGYAILSHTWGSAAEELTFDEFRTGQGRQKPGFDKIWQCCLQAQRDHLSLAWVDTCCIDKRSSTELSEAINSMYKWYANASVCYVYLADVHYGPNATISSGDPHPLIRSRWFTRGWTLQELIAPPHVSFFDTDWEFIGDRSRLAEHLVVVTGIPSDVLTLKKGPLDCSIAQRMSWAAARKTTRVEDSAYCLLGLFDANMPLLYGEGPKAFLRLQETIIEQNDDETIFAWTGVSESGTGLLAPSPAYFSASAGIRRSTNTRRPQRPPFTMTNQGLLLECQMLPCAMNTYIVPLQCEDDSISIADIQMVIFLCRTFKDQHYRRIPFDGESLRRVPNWRNFRGKTANILVSNGIHAPELMPHSGLPRISIRSPLRSWHFDNIRSSKHDTCDMALQKCLETTQVQFELQDLERGRLIAFQVPTDPESSFCCLFQIGFDLDFRPTCTVHCVPFELTGYASSVKSKPNRHASIHVQDSLWHPRIHQLGETHEEESSEYKGDRITGLISSPVSAHDGRIAYLELRPQGGLEWALTFYEDYQPAQKHRHSFRCVGEITRRYGGRVLHRRPV